MPGLLDTTKANASRVQVFAGLVQGLKVEEDAINGQFFSEVQDIFATNDQIEKYAPQVANILKTVAVDGNLTSNQEKILKLFNSLVEKEGKQFATLIDVAGDTFESVHAASTALSQLNPQPVQLPAVSAPTKAPSAPQQPPLYSPPYNPGWNGEEFGAFQGVQTYGAQVPQAGYGAPQQTTQVHIHVDQALIAQQTGIKTAPAPAATPAPAPAAKFISAKDKAAQQALIMQQQQQAAKDKKAQDAALAKAKTESLASRGLQLAAANIAANQQKIEEATATIVGLRKEWYEMIGSYMIYDALERSNIETGSLRGAAKKAALAQIPQFADFEEGIKYYLSYQSPEDDSMEVEGDPRRNAMKVWNEMFEPNYKEAQDFLAKFQISASEVVKGLKNFVPDSLASFPWAEKKTR